MTNSLRLTATRELNEEVAVIETRLLLDGILHVYGLDFREYSISTMMRKAYEYACKCGIPTISGLQQLVLHSREQFDLFLWDLFVTTTSLYRDPDFYKEFRANLLPWLKTYPFLRIWHAGCSTGEEVYSMAILLIEENLHLRSRIYATDFQEKTLAIARRGRLPLERLQEYDANYRASGGKYALSDYYIIKGSEVVLDPEILRNVTFLQHNLTTDRSFQEFNLILCRNVMIYFNKGLRNQVHQLLYDSLCHFGILCLGENESLYFTSHEMDYRHLKVGYQKIKSTA
jgi:chemotaxis protein methyltransferase CheR